jgi:hypothetical protein
VNKNLSTPQRNVFWGDVSTDVATAEQKFRAIRTFVNGDLRFQSVIARGHVQISDGTSTIVANDFRVLPQSFQAAVRIPPQITPRPFPSNTDFQAMTQLPSR